MKLMLLFAGILMTLGLAVLAHGTAGAEQAPGVRIVLVQTGGASAAHERIDIENMSSQSVDLTGWKLAYRSATSTGTTSTQLLKFTAADGWHVLLGPGGRESIVSTELIATMSTNTALSLAERFTGGLSGTGGGVQLVAPDGVVVDMVGWGTANELARMGIAAPAPSSNAWLVRQSMSGDNKTDFLSEPQDLARHPFLIGSLQEIQDLCLNIPDIQTTVPDGYTVTSGACQPIDICTNLDGIQTALPEGMELIDDGVCQVIDVCLNLPELQEGVPTGYEVTGERQCEPEIIIRKLRITELLPNPSGSDDGSEFIELYNADTEPISLKDYLLMIGEVPVFLPADRVLKAGEFLLLSDTDLGRHLPNTTGVPLYVLTVRKVEVMNVPAYMNAKDDVSWALFEDGWRYTYAPTPGAMNLAVDTLPCESGYERDATTGRCRKSEVFAAAAPVPCRDGQYRSEETGRCRNIAATPTLTPCKDGQYRSDETNRCRSLATLAVSSLKPCADDQFRNPLTNRCKSIASSDEVGALADCGEGRERNPATNRCRNIVTAAAPLAAFKAEPVKDTAEAFAGWWALGGVGLLAVGYAGWEWRREVADMLRRALELIGRH